MIDDLGRQRMLSMQIILLSQQLDDDQDSEKRLLDKASQDFEFVLSQLRGDQPTSFSTPDSVTAISLQTTKVWNELKPHIEILLDPDSTAEEIRNSQPVILVNGLRLAELSDEAVKAYRYRSELLQKRIWKILVSSTLLSFFVLITGVVLTRRNVVLPLKKLENTAQKIRHGDLKSRVGTRQTDELGTLQMAFDEMAQEIEELVVALNGERDFAQSLISRAPAGIIVHRDGKIIFANPEFFRLLAIETLDEIQNREFIGIFHCEDREKARQLSTDFAPNSSSSPPIELRLRDRKGEPLTAEVACALIDYDGTPTRLTVLRDITQRKQLTAKMMQMDRAIAISTLVAGVGHEINNPLAFILGNLDYTIQRIEELTDLPQGKQRLSGRDRQICLTEIQEVLSEARIGARRISDIVAQLRRFSRHDNTAHQPVDIHRALQSAIDMAGDDLRHQAHLVTHFEDVPPIEASESKLRQVFFNLLLNAAHAIKESDSDANYINVTLSQLQDQVIIEISDTGSGISSDDAKRIFDPFFTTKPPGQGTGLGLAICQQIIETHGGVLTFESIEYKGTTFRIAFPVKNTTSP